MGKWRILRRDGKDGETRVLGFWPRARLSYLANPRLIGMSAPSLVGMAICLDFNGKMGDFEAAWLLSYLVIWLLGDSSLSCLVMCRYIGSWLSWLSDLYMFWEENL